MFTKLNTVDSHFSAEVEYNEPCQSGSLYWDGALKAFRIIDSYSISAVVQPDMLNVRMNQSFYTVMYWAKRKMDEESRLDDLCRRYLGLKAARDNFELMKNLVK